jgi:hypothetical protein
MVPRKKHLALGALSFSYGDVTTREKSLSSLSTFPRVTAGVGAHLDFHHHLSSQDFLSMLRVHLDDFVITDSCLAKQRHIPKPLIVIRFLSVIAYVIRKYLGESIPEKVVLCQTFIDNELRSTFVFRQMRHWHVSFYFNSRYCVLCLICLIYNFET